MEWLYRILALGLYDKLTTSPHSEITDNIDHYVAAGNPGKLGTVSDSSLSSNFVYESEDSVIVSGNSMFPDGIKDGYILHTRPINSIEDINCGNLIVISVDEDFYKMRHHGKSPIFKLKLRRAIMPVPANISFEQLKKELVGTFAEVFSKRESNDLKESFEEARDYYTNEDLFLSATYHNGKIHYSFHPSIRINKLVHAVLNQSNQKLKSIDSDLLAS